MPRKTLDTQSPANASSIEVVSLRRVSHGNLRTFADVHFGTSLVIMGFRVIKQDGQDAWVSPPQREWQSADGKKHFSPLIELSGSLKQRVEAAILAAWARAEGGSDDGR
jgi:DNA-binding cell septation regulator SpoVG